MSPVDITFVIILVLVMLRGYSKGLLGTAASYVAPVLAFMLAAEWSEPAREWLAVATSAPDILLDMMAPVAVFILVVIAVRLAAALVARLLGVGRSLPSRIVAAALGAAVSAVVLGAMVLLVRELRPKERVQIDDAGDLLVSPLENTLIDLDRRINESVLGPALADLASVVVNEAMARTADAPVLDREKFEDATRKAATAAAEAIMNPKGESLRGAGRDEPRDPGNDSAQDRAQDRAQNPAQNPPRDPARDPK